MTVLDAETVKSLKNTIQWLRSRRKYLHGQRDGLMITLYARWSQISERDRHQLRDWQSLIERFDELVRHHESMLREHLAAQRQQNAESNDPRIEAISRPDALSVKEVERFPTFIDHRLASHIDQQGESLEAWNYYCLNTRHRRPTRRYEGFSRRSSVVMGGGA